MWPDSISEKSDAVFSISPVPLRRTALALTVLLAACQSLPPQEAPKRTVQRSAPAMLDDHREIARRVFDEVLNQGRYELFDTHYDPDFRKHVDGETFTLAQERQQAKGTRAIASDLNMIVDMLIAEGDYVAIRYRGIGTNDGPFGGFPPSGKRIEAHGMTIFRFAYGRIVEEWTTYNALDLLMQLGHFPPNL